MKYFLPIIAGIGLASCSGGNDALQRAEIERLEAETAKLNAEAALHRQEEERVRMENSGRAVISD